LLEASLHHAINERDVVVAIIGGTLLALALTRLQAPFDDDLRDALTRFDCVRRYPGGEPDPGELMVREFLAHTAIAAAEAERDRLARVQEKTGVAATSMRLDLGADPRPLAT
jgi:hypothetical protein